MPPAPSFSFTPELEAGRLVMVGGGGRDLWLGVEGGLGMSGSPGARQPTGFSTVDVTMPASKACAAGGASIDREGEGAAAGSSAAQAGEGGAGALSVKTTVLVFTRPLGASGVEMRVSEMACA